MEFRSVIDLAALGCSVWMRYQNETAYTCVWPDTGSALGDRLTIQ